MPKRVFLRHGSQSAWFARFVLFAILAVGMQAAAHADAQRPTLSIDAAKALFEGADRVSDLTDEPHAFAVYSGETLLGYAISTSEVVGSTGFSGKPIDIAVGLGTDGFIKRARLMRHEEPILVIGLSSAKLDAFVASFAGVDIRKRLVIGKPSANFSGWDGVSGATITSSVIADAILRSARTVARARGFLGKTSSTAPTRLDLQTYAPAGWRDLMEDGSITTLTLTNGDVASALRAQYGEAGSALQHLDPDALFAELHIGLATPPRIGQNLLGALAFNRFLARTRADDQAILVAANGRYSFKGTNYIRSGLFDRIQLVQGDKTIELHKEAYQNVESFSPEVGGAPDLREIALFTIPAEAGFDPLLPWRLDLLVTQKSAHGENLSQTFSLEYHLPDRYRLKSPEPSAGVYLTETGAPDQRNGAASAPTQADEPASYLMPVEDSTLIWMDIWRARLHAIGLVIFMLLILATVLVFQDSVAKNPEFPRFRLIFLAVTLLWLGLIAGGQLSVINVLTFSQAVRAEFQWQYFLVDPVVFILWSFVALAMMFWGRGVFCGWLCPFGALQELANQGARRLGIPQIKIPFALHERLWPIKYIIFIGLFAVSLNSMLVAAYGVEIEPFKTVISLKFLRPWPFVLYAAVLLLLGLFIERFFCRYLCPLGAALALPARLRMFDWLKRRHECGRECRICADRCTVQAIHPNGSINPNECIHCLGCQTIYFDDSTCPPLLARRKRREAVAARRDKLRTPANLTS